MFFSYEGRVASSDDSESIRLSKENLLEVNFPWMSCKNEPLTKIEGNVHPINGSDIHLCLSDRFHEGNSSSDIEYLRRINNIPQLNSVVNSQVQEQLHLRFDKNKSFLNMMKPANHIFLFRSIINYYNKAKFFIAEEIQQQIPLPITSDIYGRAIYEINSEDGLMKKSSSENVEDCSSEKQGPLSDDEPLSPCVSSYASSLSNSEPFSYTPDNLSDHFDAATDELWLVAYSLRMTIGDKRQIMDRCSLNVNIISLAMRLLSYLNDQVFCWNDLLNVGTSEVWYLKYLNDKKFVQILPLYEHHYVVIANLELSTEEANTIYIFDPCIEFSYLEMDNDIKYPKSFIKTCCNFTENAKENQFQINECSPSQFAA